MDVFKEIFRIFSNIFSLFNKIKLNTQMEGEKETKKYALVLGINEYSKEFYGDDIVNLGGCVVDAKKYETFLKDRIVVDDIKVLLDSEATKEAFRFNIKKLITKMKEGDILYLFSSRHGTKVKDESGDEDSGYDQAMCLHDGLILDDELNDLKNHLPNNSDFIIFSDACENGTISKGSYGNARMKVKTTVVSHEKFREEKEECKSLICKTTEPTNVSVLTLSGADDWNFSFDFGEDGGNFTNTWFEVLDENESISWEDAFSEVETTIKLQAPFIDKSGDIDNRISKREI